MHIIEAQNLKKRYDGFSAVADVSFNIRQGEIFALLGPNGAGKTTILKILCGLIKPSSGSIKVNVQHKDIRSVIGYMPEESALYDSMHVSEYLRFFADLFNVAGAVAEKSIAQLLDFLRLEDKAIGELSKGMRRKVLLARSLINDPQILIYDEPASGLDPVIAQGLLEHILKLKDQGKTVVLSAHDLTQVEEISDTLLILNKGLVDVSGRVSDIKAKYGHSTYEVMLSKGSKVFSDKRSMLRFLNKRVRDIRFHEPSLHEIFVEKFKNG
jgi:ABC-2 type transport system ATP-binding protein